MSPMSNFEYYLYNNYINEAGELFGFDKFEEWRFKKMESSIDDLLMASKYSTYKKDGFLT